MSDDKKRDDDYTVDIEKEKLLEQESQSDIMPPSNKQWQDHPAVPVLSYCASSIMMTVTNKYVLSGLDYNLNFLLLAVQVSIRSLPPALGTKHWI